MPAKKKATPRVVYLQPKMKDGPKMRPLSASKSTHKDRFTGTKKKKDGLAIPISELKEKVTIKKGPEKRVVDAFGVRTVERRL